MSEPLDLSRVGAGRPAPAPSRGTRRKAPGKAPGKLPKVPRKASGRPPVAAILALVVVVAAGVGVYLLFGRGGGKPATAASSIRFCELVQGLDRVAPDEVNGLPPAQAKAALAQLGPTAEELKTAAPKRVRGDVSAALGALRDAAGGNAEAVKSASYHRHRQRITDVIQQCAPGGGAGDQ
ncbi:MAG TPA: hypothetical protein VFJ85_01460 [Acidimicrobiales bacterium]|nr:hypothetical protein [Acidimicrobiales bacterium]